MGQSLDKYSKMPVSKAVIQNALPAVAAMLMVLIYNLADTFFIGQTHDAYQVAAVSLATPVFLVLCLLVLYLGLGEHLLYQELMGKEKKNTRKRYVLFVCGVVLQSEFFLPLDF